jgi:hypothetical protein
MFFRPGPRTILRPAFPNVPGVWSTKDPALKYWVIVRLSAERFGFEMTSGLADLCPGESDHVTVQANVHGQAGAGRIHAVKLPASQTVAQKAIGALRKERHLPNGVDSNRVRLILGSKRPLRGDIQDVVHGMCVSSVSWFVVSEIRRLRV